MEESAGIDLRKNEGRMTKAQRHVMLEEIRDDNEDGRMKTESAVLTYVREILCSKGWTESIQSEIQRADTKMRIYLLRTLKAYKHENPGGDAELWQNRVRLESCTNDCRVHHRGVVPCKHAIPWYTTHTFHPCTHTLCGPIGSIHSYNP